MSQEIGNSLIFNATPVTPKLFSISVGGNEGRVSTPVRTLRTISDIATSPAARHTSAARRFPLLTVLATAPIVWPIAATAVLAIALWSTAHDRVPIGSGLAVAILAIAAIVDVRERRLPNTIVITASVAFWTAIAIEGATWGLDLPVASVAGGIAAFGGPLLALHLVTPAAMGFGDVKTAMVLGAALGIVDWQLALAALALAAGVTATVGVATQASTIAFGPGLVAASAIMLAAHPMLLTDAHRPVGAQPAMIKAGGNVQTLEVGTQ